MRTLRSVFIACTALAAIAAPTVAQASPIFPSAVQMDLSLSYTPPCTICHTSSVGNITTATQPFAQAMRAAGLQLENTASLQAALMTLESNNTDSDCNMIPDIQQLKDGRDPNAPGEYINGVGGPELQPDPGCSNAAAQPFFGCEAQLARLAPEPSGIAALAALAGGLLACRRRRPRRVRRPTR